MSSQQVSLLLVVVFVVLEYATITIAISRLRGRVHKLEVAAQPKDEPMSLGGASFLSTAIDSPEVECWEPDPRLPVARQERDWKWYESYHPDGVECR